MILARSDSNAVRSPAPRRPASPGAADHAGAASRLVERLAAVGFVLLFPAFLTYHYGISAGWWSPLLGGLFGAGSMLVALAAAATLLDRRGSGRRLTALHLLFLACIVFMATWSLSQWPGLSHDALAQPIMVEAFATVVIWVAMLFVGSRFPSDDRTIRHINTLGVGAVLLSFGHAFYTGGFPAGPFLAFVGAEEGGHATYQGVGRSLLAVTIVAALASRPHSVRAILTLLGATALMLALGSRAHFFALGVSVGIQLLLLMSRRQTRWIGIAGVVITAVVIAVGAGLFLETRASEIVDLASSASWEERSRANERALQIIAEHPLVGSFGYHTWDSAGYAHNALSAWTQYGLVGFALYAITMAAAAGIAVAGFAKTRGSEPAWHLALHFNVIGIVLAIASEPIMSSVFPALAWGFTIRALRTRRDGRLAHRS